MLNSGYIFLELYTQKLQEYTLFFQRVCGFKLIRDEGDFIELRSCTSLVLLNSDRDELPEGHAFKGKLFGYGQGVGVEIGIVISDLPIAHKIAMEFTGWEVTVIRNQDWGLTDFRVTTPDGYYFRFTSPFE